MSMSEIFEPFARLLSDIATPAAVRALEVSGDVAPIWSAVEASGYLDILVGEEFGGAGLTLSDAAPIFELLGRHALPLPIGDTMLARALLARAGVEYGADYGSAPIALVTGAQPCVGAGFASAFLTGSPTAPVLQAAEVSATGVHGDRSAVVSLSGSAELRPVAAILRALTISGAAHQLLEMTVAYANDRAQFGKPIGKFQAVQQQLAVLAEQAVAARIAAAMGARAGLDASPLQAALAKHNASVAAAQIAPIAHGVHGAIGISEEYDLQLFTRRLNEWRMADGSEAYWADVVGHARLGQPDVPTTQFIRSAI
ncbi:acyl-CoA dehydrogenase [Sphingopyxis yananensis]|uniref:acyl-CoA dehydrogenase n=1 Tax=Sphingopyxis yananensis TaxID=2886687 RepID=UPI001D11E65F|nr:acyl-CoA dehydrogenase [Sphingopyxis yananensis]MCC2603124.1 acyl-CoA dehydrogenase [Sphingopyxis yananensis]